VVAMLDTPAPSIVAQFPPSLPAHQHSEIETCPWCGQDIPPERLEEISGKIVAKEYERTQVITLKLEQQHAINLAQVETRAKEDMEGERKRSATGEAAAREEGRQAAEVAAANQILEAERRQAEREAELQTQIETIRAVGAEQLRASETARLQSEAELRAR